MMEAPRVHRAAKLRNDAALAWVDLPKKKEEKQTLGESKQVSLFAEQSRAQRVIKNNGLLPPFSHLAAAWANITHTPRMPEAVRVNSRITVWMSVPNAITINRSKFNWWQQAATAGHRIPFALTKFKHLTPSGRCQQIYPWPPHGPCPFSDIPLKTKNRTQKKKNEKGSSTKTRNSNEKMPNKKQEGKKFTQYCLQLKSRRRCQTKAKTEKAKNKRTNTHKLTCSSSHTRVRA